MSNILFNDRILNGETKYIEVPVRDGKLGATIAWKDATSSATVTLELTSNLEVSLNSTTAWHWKDSGLTVTGPAASAAGATVLNVENVRQKRARLKIVGAATSEFHVTDGTAP